MVAALTNLVFSLNPPQLIVDGRPFAGPIQQLKTVAATVSIGATGPIAVVIAVVSASDIDAAHCYSHCLCGDWCYVYCPMSGTGSAAMQAIQIAVASSTAITVASTDAAIAAVSAAAIAVGAIAVAPAAAIAAVSLL